MKQESKEDEGEVFLKELGEAFEDLRERFEIEETKEKEREWDTIIEKYPIILVWERGFKQWKKERNKINMRKAGELIGCRDETFSIPMVKHHVTEWRVVFMPLYIHQHVNHKLGDGKLEGVVG